MANIWITSDHHFGHDNILKFLLPDGSHMREFPSTAAMDEHMVQEWNKVVKPSDKVYHLGDVAIKKAFIKTVGRCNGHKRLVRGNHDIYPTKCYLPFFEDVYGTRVLDDLILSHIPIHPESIRENWTNVHGHTHNNLSPLHFGTRYFNVSVEVTDYRPLAIEEVRQRIRLQRAENQRLIAENLSRMGIAPVWHTPEFDGSDEVADY